jgi:transcriptional regulator of heat shock response
MQPGLHNLTQRQIEILKSLIEEYIKTAEAVGSETLEKRHSISASPATIRNEMVRLTEMGYLKKPHSSAGRMPTAEGMKFYVSELMKEKELSVGEEVAFKEKVWDFREQQNKFLRQLTRSLAEKTGTLAIATNAEGELYCSGYSHILEMPEFYDIDITKNLLEALDQYDYINRLMSRVYSQEEEEDVHILLGDDLESVLRGPYSLVYTSYTTPMQQRGAVGVIGPVRLNYTYVVPTVRSIGNLIEEIARGW